MKNVTPFKRFKNSRIALGVFGFLVITGIASSVYTVDATEKAVIFRFGKYHDTRGEGLHFRLPYRIDVAVKVKTENLYSIPFELSSQQQRLAGSYMLTGDLNIVEMAFVVQYRIENPENWLINVNDPVKTLTDLSLSAMNELIGDRGIMRTLGPERENIQVNAQRIIQSTLDNYQLGAKIESVQIQNILPPRGAVQDAFEDVNKAEQDRKRYINEGDEIYNKEIYRIEGESQRMVEEAEGYKIRRINEAEGDKNRFISILNEYQKSPQAAQVMRERLYLEMVEELFIQGNVEVIDKNLENFLPLKQITGSSRGETQ